MTEPRIDPVPERLREAERAALLLQPLPGQDRATFEATRRRIMGCYDTALAATPAKAEGLAAGGHRMTRTKSELSPLTAEEQIALIRRALADGLVLDRFAGSVPIFHRAATPAKAEGYTGEGTLIANPDGTATLAPAKAEGLDTGNECLAVIEPDEAIHFCLLPEGHSGEHRTALQLDEERLVAAAIRLNERETLLDGRTIETIARQLAAAYRADTATEGEDR